MILNLTYDSSVASAPIGFTAALNNVVNFFESNFHDPVTVTIAVGYGEVKGQPLSGGAGASISMLDRVTYAQLTSALANDATSSADVSAVASLPASDPTGGSYYVTTAEMKALNLGTYSGTDGWMGFSNTAGKFDYDKSNGVTAGQDDFFAVAAHEISEVMGRQLMVGSPGYTPLDLFHFSSPGKHIYAGTQSGYFSVDNGTTNLHNFNTIVGGDFGDWLSSGGPDAFNASISTGLVYPVSESDMQTMDAIGWDRSAPSPLPDLNITNFVASASSASFTVHNVGTDPSPATVTGIYLSSDQTITPSDTLIGSAATPALAQNASDAETVSITLPANLAAGTYYIGAFADSTGAVAEANELNNASTPTALVVGDGGANSLVGTSGNDLMFGYGGNDTLNGGSGNDTMTGGTGNDTYYVNAAGDVVTENPGEGTDTVMSTVSYTLGAALENLTLTGSKNINATGNAVGNVLIGNTGNNVLTGLGGADTLDGGAGIDKANYAGSPAGVNVSLSTGQGSGGDAQGDVLSNIENVTGSKYADTLQGDGGNNALVGGGGNDVLTGGAGADTLTGGSGADTLTGGTGADHFLYNATSESSTAVSHDRILDFSSAEADLIDLSPIDANTLVSGNQAFTFIGTQNFHGIAGELHYVANPTGVTVSGDVNGDGVADFSIDVNVASLLSTDFIL